MLINALRRHGCTVGRVDAITLADAVALAPTKRIELIKMDIEGEEVAALREAPPKILQRIAQLTVESTISLIRPASRQSLQ